MTSGRDLGERIAGIGNREGVTYHRGEVVSMTGNKASVYIDGDQTAASPPLTVLASALPLSAGDIVHMFAVGDGDFLILGKSG